MKFIFLNLLLICLGLVQGDLIGFNRNQNNMNTHLAQRRTYHSTSIIPVNDVDKMKKTLRLLNKKRYKQAAAVLQQANYASMIKSEKNNKPRRKRLLAKFLARPTKKFG